MSGQARIRLIAALVLPLLAGCAHNDVLVFGTNTTLGINVQTASAGVGPSVVVGYERQEAVWMPLLVNARDTRLPLCPPQANGACTAGSTAYPLDQAMYRSTIQTPDGVSKRTDAYSVFASLGARFNGSANGQEVAAGGGLAQFFATGNAALNVSSNEALVTALKIEGGEGADAQARAVEAATLSTDQLAIIEEIRRERAKRLKTIQDCVATNEVTWSQIVADSGLLEEALERAAGAPDPDAAWIARTLDGFEDGMVKLAQSSNKLCQAGG